MTDADDIPTLRQLPKDKVDALCDRALELAPDSYGMRQEAEAFRESRTPWDATRLANILSHVGKGNVLINELVTDIDVAAEDCAELVPPNRDSERL